MGLVAGTFLFSVAAGLGEVLVSPVIAALPSDTPDKDMSMLHALYGYGLALTRTIYAKYGKNIFKILTISMWGAVVCYLTVGLSSNGALSLAACAAVGICTAMLWPGTLIFMEEKIPAAGVAAYALMAAVFPALGILLLAYMKTYFGKEAFGTKNSSCN